MSRTVILRLEVALLFQCLGRVVGYYWCIGSGVSVCMSGIGTVSIISSYLTLIQGKKVRACVWYMCLCCWLLVKLVIFTCFGKSENIHHIVMS